MEVAGLPQWGNLSREWHKIHPTVRMDYSFSTNNLPIIILYTESENKKNENASVSYTEKHEICCFKW